MSRRSVLSAVTLTVLVALLVVGGVAGYRALVAPIPDSQGSAGPTHPCRHKVAKGDLVRSTDVTVSVFNAGTRTGLAGQTLDQLAARGFIKGSVGNAPNRFAAVRFVRVLAPSSHDPVARLVALQFGRHTLVQPVKRSQGRGVEVVVGDAFVGLTKAPTKLRAATAGTGC
ncbi:MAG: hypothetical protein QOK15_2024 [Nocardioidaceae bacterium]|nr:hypothetical protein [Nocardioidaceae bacterium]